MKYLLVFLMPFCLNFNSYLFTIHKDFRTKSIKGWIRIINNKEKRKEYNIILNKSQIEKYTNELLELKKKKDKGAVL